MRNDPDSLQRLVKDVLSSRKYSQISPSFVLRLAQRELLHRRNYKEALKATKNKLHQVAGSYLEKQPDYTHWIERLRTAHASSQPAALKDACRELMAQHASTRERLPLLDEFYQVVLEDLPPIHSVLDIACGLNPLALPWMGLSQGVTYIAVDIYQDMLDFLSKFIQLMGITAHTAVTDVLEFSFEQEVDLALVLKAIPCLEQLDRSAGKRLLQTIPARHLLISFPLYSLGGRSVGMPETYTSHMQQLLSGKPWSVRRFEFSTELAFLISRSS
jgi:16S rRNA (guanine(1405)-N(7))-methyltransferase